MSSWRLRDRWPANARAFVDRRTAVCALVLAAVLVVFTIPAGAHAASALARTTNELTGVGDASRVTAEKVCPPSTATRATCYAQMLVSSTSHQPVHPRLAAPSYQARKSARRFSAQSVASGTSEPQPGSPAYLQQAYDLSYLSQNRGAGDTVAIVDAYNSPTAEGDLAAYRAHFGLSPCTTQNGCFRKVDQNGGQAFPASGPGWSSEISLDLDAVSALCPRCKILLVEANSSASSDLVVAQATAAALGANQISDSWGAPTTFIPSGQYTFPGVATVAAAGDNGFLGLLQSQYPASLPGVTAAGGTALIPASTSGSARGFTEQAWSGSGSGCNLAIAKPAWQSDPGCSGRSYADLSASADPGTGMDVYDSSNGGWVLMGGTSESTPLIAAYYAITGASATPAWAYANQSRLNDPVGQSNGTGCPLAIAYICLSGLGYDGPTGVGSISGAVAAGAPGIGGPGPSGDYTQSASATSATLQAGIYPNGSDTTYAWQYGITAGYGRSTAPADIGSGPGPATVNSTLSGLAPGTTYHYRLAAQNAFGTTYGYDFTLTTTGAPSAPTVSGVRASVTGRRGAKLNATIYGQGGGAGTYHFIYGTGHSYQHSTPSMPVAGATSTPVSATITGLSPHTTYHVKLVASNAGGSAQSASQTFTTMKKAPQRGRRHRARHAARHR